MEIVFLEPDTPHPSSNQVTNYEVASELEERFKLCERFTDFILPALEKRIEDHLLYASDTEFDLHLGRLEDWLKGEWRNYIVNEKHGIKTKSAKDRGGKSFIITTSYYTNMLIKLKV